jgi:hypothetical protein
MLHQTLEKLRKKKNMFGGRPHLSDEEKEFNRKIVQLTILQIALTAITIALGIYSKYLPMFL